MNTVNPRNFKFCPVCGDKLEETHLSDEQKNRLMCVTCGFIFYMNPTPAVAVILFRNKEILLVKRKFEPQKGGWTLPAGFMEYGETAEQTAIRETKEETNLDIEIKNIFNVLPGFDDTRVHVVLIIYTAEIKGGELSPGDDASDVNFFSLNNLPNNIAFSAHKKLLKTLADKNL